MQQDVKYLVLFYKSGFRIDKTGFRKVMNWGYKQKFRGEKNANPCPAEMARFDILNCKFQV